MLDPDGHKEKTAHNRKSSAQILEENNIKFTSNNAGAHLIIYHQQKALPSPIAFCDFWPGTGLFIFRNMAIGKGRGVFNLIKKIKELKT